MVTPTRGRKATSAVAAFCVWFWAPLPLSAGGPRASLTVQTPALSSCSPGEDDPGAVAGGAGPG